MEIPKEFKPQEARDIEDKQFELGESNIPPEKEGAEKKEGLSGLFAGFKGIGIRKAQKEIGAQISSMVQDWSERFKEFKWRMPEIKTPEIIKNLKDKKILGVSVVGFLSGAGSAAALRFAVRTALGGGAGIAIGAATGAITGGTIEGVKAYRRELERVKKEGPASKEKLQSIAEQISAEKEPSLKSKLDSYLEMVRREEEGTLIAEFIEPKQKLYEELKNELKLESVRKKEIIKGILTGAVVGGIGGAVGGYLSSLISDHFMGSGVKESLKEELLGAGRGAKEAGKAVTAEVLQAKIDAASSEAYQKTYEKALAVGIEGLKEQTFTASAEKGEGLTHVARRLVHDYIVQEKSLGEFPDLAKSQLVYAEDALRRMFEEGAVNPGDAFTADGKDIADIIAGAKNLSEAQLQNLGKEWVPMISEKTWEKILDYGEPHSALNNFSESINEVKGQAAGAAKTAAEEAGRNLAVRLPISPEAIKAKDAWFRSSLIKYAGIGALIAGGAAAAYKFREPLKNLASRSRAFNMREHINRISKKAKEGLKKAHVAEEKLPEKPEQIEEEKKKIAADPLIKFYADNGFDIKPGEITYQGPAPEDIGKERANILSFNNYSDFRAYWDSLTPEQRKKAPNYKGKFSGFGIWAPPKFWKKLDETPALKERSDELQQKALRGMLADEYNGLPAKEEISEAQVEEVRSAIEKEFGITVGRALRGNTEGYVDAEEELEGLKKLSDVFKMLPSAHLTTLLNSYFLSIGTKEYSAKDTRWIEVNPYLSAQEMRDYFIKIVEKG